METSLPSHHIRELDDSANWGLLLDQAFVPPGTGGRFFDDFPIWNSERSDVSRFGIFVENNLLAACGVWQADFKNNDSTVSKLGLIGGVVTHPDVRGRGYATSLLSFAMNQTATVSGWALWATESSFYERMGFLPAGEQIRGYWDRAHPAHVLDSGETLERGLSKDAFELLVRCRKNGRIIHESDYLFYLSHRNTDWISLRNFDDEVTAVIAMNRGIDLQDHIHEMAGDSDSIIKLIDSVRARCLNLQVLCPAETPEALLRLINPSVREPAMLFRPNPLSLSSNSLDPRLLFAWGLDAA